MGSIKAEKVWADAIRKAVYKRIDDPEDPQKTTHKINVLAGMLVARAIEGDIGAIKEIGDRLDGKPKPGSGDESDPWVIKIIDATKRD